MLTPNLKLRFAIRSPSCDVTLKLLSTKTSLRGDGPPCTNPDSWIFSPAFYPEFTHCVCCVACLTTQRSDMVDPLSRWNSDPPTIAARGVNTSSENGREKRPALMATCKRERSEGKIGQSTFQNRKNAEGSKMLTSLRTPFALGARHRVNELVG